MKTKTINIYSASELQQENKHAFENAHEGYEQDCYNWGIAWTSEIIDSLNAVFDASGINLSDYSIDSYSHSYVKFDMNDDTRDLQGARAQAWLENNLLSGLRIDYASAKRWELSKYGSYYRAGMIKPCPFTGVCYDEDFLDALRDSVRAGATIGEAYDNLAELARKLFENEWDDQLSEEYFVDHADSNEWEYDEDGNRI